MKKIMAAAVAAIALAGSTAALAQAGTSTAGNSGIRDREGWRQYGWDHPYRTGAMPPHRRHHVDYEVDPYAETYVAPYPGYYEEQPVYVPRTYRTRGSRWEQERRFERSAGIGKEGGPH